MLPQLRRLEGAVEEVVILRLSKQIERKTKSMSSCLVYCDCPDVCVAIKMANDVGARVMEACLVRQHGVDPIFLSARGSMSRLSEARRWSTTPLSIVVVKVS